MTAYPETWIPCSNCGRYFDPDERNLKWTTRSTDEEFALNRICGGCTDVFFTAMRAYREVLREKGEMRCQSLQSSPAPSAGNPTYG